LGEYEKALLLTDVVIEFSYRKNDLVINNPTAWPDCELNVAKKALQQALKPKIPII